MKPKIFISSTYHDLIPYRKELWEVLAGEDLNLEILGMEKFGARSTTALETCLREVSIADVYIGIIAYRYGSIDKESNKSYTQLEYERALDCKKEILIYIMDENTSIQPKYVDLSTKGNKLLTLKKLLRKNHTVDTFLDPSDLAKKVYDKLKLTIPKLPRKFIRPHILKCKIHRFSVDNENWIAFVGFLDNFPIEIFIGLSDNEMFPIPTIIEEGKIVKVINESNEIRYDFVYIDNYGYKNTLGGLNHVFNKQMTHYINIITTLLMNFTPLSTIYESINNMTIDDFDNPEDWKKGVKEALKK